MTNVLGFFAIKILNTDSCFVAFFDIKIAGFWFLGIADSAHLMAAPYNESRSVLSFLRPVAMTMVSMPVICEVSPFFR